MLQPPSAIISVIVAQSHPVRSIPQHSQLLNCQVLVILLDDLLPQETGPVWTCQAMVGVPSSATAPVMYAGVCFSPGSEPFPAQLVRKVRSGAYIELLGDNISLLVD